MERMEMVEKLREKANLTIEEAKEVLERNEWDLLNALVELEKEGKMNSEQKSEEKEAVKAEATKEEPKAEETCKAKKARCHKLREACKTLIHMGIDNKFVVRKEEEELFRVPVIVPLLCAAVAFWMTAIALFVGLLFNLKYSFEGKELGKDVINNTMEKASEAANNLVNNLAE